MQVGIRSNRRRVAPFWPAGGAPGKGGRNWIERADGTKEAITGKDRREVRAGDVVVVETPGGGGFG